jgi:hypothetical protein
LGGAGVLSFGCLLLHFCSSIILLQITVHHLDSQGLTPPNLGYFDQAEFADNPEPRCPVVLVLDTSGSMKGEPILRIELRCANLAGGSEE